MRILKFKKNTGCIIEVIVFDNGFTVSSWQTDVPEIAVYQNLNQFLKIRTKQRGYEKILDIKINENGDIRREIAKYKGMKVSKIKNSIKIELNDIDATHLITSIEMAECEGVVNRASKLKTMLEVLLK